MFDWLLGKSYKFWRCPNWKKGWISYNANYGQKISCLTHCDMGNKRRKASTYCPNCEAKLIPVLED